MAPKGRKKLERDQLMLIAQLSDDEFKLLREVLLAPDVASNLDGAWRSVQMDRLRLAKSHLKAASALNHRAASEADQRSVVSRAYYAMFRAARAALSYFHSGDRNDHQKIPDWIAKSPLGLQNG